MRTRLAVVVALLIVSAGSARAQKTCVSPASFAAQDSVTTGMLFRGIPLAPDRVIQAKGIMAQWRVTQCSILNATNQAELWAAATTKRNDDLRALLDSPAAVKQFNIKLAAETRRLSPP